jgi:hypothetical protein
MPEVRLGDAEEVVVWCVVVEWRLECTVGEEERRRWKREGLRAGAVVAGGGLGSRREPKRGILILIVGLVEVRRGLVWRFGFTNFDGDGRLGLSCG